MLKFLLIAAIGGLAGCSSTAMGRMNSYSFPVHQVNFEGSTYRIYEHKTDKSLMVSPGLGKIVAVGAARGATLGFVDPMTPEQKMRAASQHYLSTTGRSNCQISGGGLLQQPMYEFTYACQ